MLVLLVALIFGNPLPALCITGIGLFAIYQGVKALDFKNHRTLMNQMLDRLKDQLPPSDRFCSVAALQPDEAFTQEGFMPAASAAPGKKDTFSEPLECPRISGPSATKSTC